MMIVVIKCLLPESEIMRNLSFQNSKLFTKCWDPFKYLSSVELQSGECCYFLFLEIFGFLIMVTFYLLIDLLYEILGLTS